MRATGPRRSLGHRFLIECRNTLFGVVLAGAVIAAAIGVVIWVTAIIAR
jgi:hypothetical protein